MVKPLWHLWPVLAFLIFLNSHVTLGPPFTSLFLCCLLFCPHLCPVFILIILSFISPQTSDDEDYFSVSPTEMFLKVGEEQEILVSFKAQYNRKCRERYTKICSSCHTQYSTFKCNIIIEFKKHLRKLCNFLFLAPSYIYDSSHYRSCFSLWFLYNISECFVSLCSSLLTILVVPSGPQYEVSLKGEIVSEESGKSTIPSTAGFAHGVANDVPPILSNKQFVAWGGVTLGRAM